MSRGPRQDCVCIEWRTILYDTLPFGKRVTAYNTSKVEVGAVQEGDRVSLHGKTFVVTQPCDNAVVTLYRYYIVHYCVPCWITFRQYGHAFVQTCDGVPYSIKDDPPDVHEVLFIPPTAVDIVQPEISDIPYFYGKQGDLVPLPKPTEAQNYDVGEVKVYNPVMGVLPRDSDINLDMSYPGTLAFASPEDFWVWEAAAREKYDFEIVAAANVPEGGGNKQLPDLPLTTYTYDADHDPYSNYVVSGWSLKDSAEAELFDDANRNR